jgi:hypothetical protein
MHMAVAHRLRDDTSVSSAVRERIAAHWGAFLLGNIAADARVSSGLQRRDTHFFDYQPVLKPSPHTVMLATHPELRFSAVSNAARQVFIAGYCAHLAMDEVWCTDMLYPLFDDWGSPRLRFEMLHMLLGALDERDYLALPRSDFEPLYNTQPENWLPFMTDADLIGWRNVVAEQIAPGASSRTFEIFSGRIQRSVADLAAFIHDEEEMQRNLWANVSRQAIRQVEASMYAHARHVLVDYFADAIQ